jgi:uncharacterized protein (DUF983 family)
MCATTNDKKPDLLWSVLSNKCPRCRRGKLYKERNAYKFNSFMRMHDDCPVCGQPFDMEPGFYYGTSYVSYGLSIFICVFSLVAWWIFIGFSLTDNRFFWWMGFNALLLVILQPLIMRLSRSVWLAFFVHYDHDWKIKPAKKPERVNKDLKNAW